MPPDGDGYELSAVPPIHGSELVGDDNKRALPVFVATLPLVAAPPTFAPANPATKGVSAATVLRFEPITARTDPDAPAAYCAEIFCHACTNAGFDASHAGIWIPFCAINVSSVVPPFSWASWAAISWPPTPLVRPDQKNAVFASVATGLLFVATLQLNGSSLLLIRPTRTPQNDTIAGNRP